MAAGSEPPVTPAHDIISSSGFLLIMFNRCCKDAGFFMVFKCREENAALKECLTRHYQDPAFFEECKQEYLKEKQEFQQTGIPGKNRKQKLPTSM
ncbi:COX assembly mitochondrial protein homolog isoform X2 [Ctenopharyngodon idella]|uniref:COX assembly mitochondrial protein homolog isoform X2 n=1 Tax=Ctenopharyngodon idella TaxID=7959 RepID=UPI002232C2B2|nr:COX assembly mitochondrial protein homolog isoform X2 [Ctenopharyngodon idella]